MEEAGWKKDETPYLIFTCSKCKQYLYVKTTQKTKKCLRCGRQHKVPSIINSGEIVEGMTKAVEIVKTRQNELAIKEIGHNPELRADDDFTIKGKSTTISNINEVDDNNEFYGEFTNMLQKISESYDQFPFYVFEIMAENFGIPLSELKFLIKAFQKKGIIINSEGNLYRLKKNKTVLQS